MLGNIFRSVVAIPAFLIGCAILYGVVSGFTKEGGSLGAEYIVAAKRLNCRSAPKANAPVITTFEGGSTVRIFTTSGIWGKTVVDKSECWVNGRLLSDTAGSNQSVPAPSGPTRVQLVMSNGTYQVPAVVNGQSVDFIVDSGASGVSIPEDIFGPLATSGVFRHEDIIGFQNFTLADGSQSTELAFRIRSISVGGVEIRDVDASVSPSGSPMLLGQSYLGRLHSWSQDNLRHELVIE